MSSHGVVTCSFRFELRPENETVELVAGRDSARVCKNCLVLLAVHRRVHEMKIERLIPVMAESR